MNSLPYSDHALFTVSKHRLDTCLRGTHPQAVRKSPVTTVLKQIKTKKKQTNQKPHKPSTTIKQTAVITKVFLIEADSQIYPA